MWEWNYGQEPFDLKLLVLRLIKNIWMPIIAALLGAAIVGGGYYLIYDVFGEESQYELTTTYYVEYSTDPGTGKESSVFIHETWGSLILTDWFVDRIWDEAINAGLQPAKYSEIGYGEDGIEKRDLQDFLYAGLVSDLRMPESTVTTPDPELTVLLADAVEKVFFAFGEEQREIESVRVVDRSEVSLTDRDIRTFRACVLGAVLAVFFTLLAMLLYYVVDAGIYVPETFSCRYGIPALGAVAGCEEGVKLLENAAVNVAYRFRDCATVGITSVEEDTDLKAVADLLTGKEYVCIPSILQVPEAAEKLREMDGVLLLVQAGVANSKQIVQVLHDLQIQDCKVEGVLLTDADEKLLKAYRIPGYRGKKK